MTNAINSAAREKFSPKQLHGKTWQQQIQMLKEIGVDYDTDYPVEFRMGRMMVRIPCMDTDNSVDNSGRIKTTIASKTVLPPLWKSNILSDTIPRKPSN